MPDNPSWNDIFSTPPTLTMVTPPPTSVPRVLGSPTCDRHCSGTHHIEAVVRCPRCRSVAAHIWQHEWQHDAGHYFTVTAPTNGYQMGGPNQCRDCRVEFERA